MRKIRATPPCAPDRGADTMISVIPERPVGAWWATGLTTAERRQTAEPEWAGFITRAIAGWARFFTLTQCFDLPLW